MQATAMAAAEGDAGASFYFERVQRALDIPPERRSADVRGFLEAHELNEAAAAVLLSDEPPDSDAYVAAALQHQCASSAAWESLVDVLDHPSLPEWCFWDRHPVPRTSEALEQLQASAPINDVCTLAHLLLAVTSARACRNIAFACSALTAVQRDLRDAAAARAMAMQLTQLRTRLDGQLGGSGWRVPGVRELSAACARQLSLVLEHTARLQTASATILGQLAPYSSVPAPVRHRVLAAYQWQADVLPAHPRPHVALGGAL